MARRTCTFKQIDATRAVRAAIAAGIDVGRIEVALVKGNITIEPSTSSEKPVNELDEWMTDTARVGSN